MLKYIVKRLLIFIPAFFAISLITFYISTNTPGDPVKNMLSFKGGLENYSGRMAGRKAYREKRKELGLDLPLFYFSISTLAKPDTFYTISNTADKSMLNHLLNQYGNWKEISVYYHDLQTLENTALAMNADDANKNTLIEARNCCSRLLTQYKAGETQNTLHKLLLLTRTNPALKSIEFHTKQTIQDFQVLREKATKWKNYLPAIHIYGRANQYHRWLFGDGLKNHGFIRGDFGISYKTQRPVSAEIREAVKWTLMLSLLAIFITYLIAIPLGIYSAVHRGSLFDQGVNTILFMLYSLPSFWVGIMLIVFFGGGDFLNWFPPYGVGEITASMGFWQIFSVRLSHLVLPLICLTYPTFAFLSRQTRASILNVMYQDYIRTARAKGLSEFRVIWKHGFKNALLPIITLFANVFPYAITGSFIVETVFSIPGMGHLTLNALNDRNYPLVYTTVMLASVMTMIGFLVADILYAVADPRITFNSNKALT